MKRWYVVHTHPAAEGKAVWHLQRQGYAPYLPRYLKRRRHARKTESVAAPLFPGYLFVSMDVARTRWRAIRSTIGIRSLICHGDTPAPVPEGIVEKIKAQEDENGVVPVRPSPPFARGDTVTVTQGPFSDQMGIFQCVSDDERVIVLLNLLGRQLRVPLTFDSVRAFA